VPQSAVEKVHAHLRQAGEAGLEGLGLWVGKVEGDTAFVEQGLIPKQQHIRSASGVGVYIEGDELHRLNVWLFGKDLRILAQIHSHPTSAYHSDTDDDFAIATVVGSLSLVVPDFASRPFAVSDTAVYRLDRLGDWVEVPAKNAHQLISIVVD